MVNPASFGGASCPFTGARNSRASPRVRSSFISRKVYSHLVGTNSRLYTSALQTQMVTTRQFRPSTAFWEAARIALDSLRKNKLRSFLTLLGIILATTTLISVTALIHGMNLYIAEKVSNMGADGFRVVRMGWFGPWDPKKFFEMDKRNPQIKQDEFDFIKEKARLVKD